MIADGKHPAQIFDVTRFKTEDGRDAVSFVWELTDCGERISSSLTLVDARGLKNHFGICLVKKWAPDWPGDDLDWFPAHVSELHLKHVFVNVRGGKVDWIFPDDYWAGAAKAGPKSEDGGERSEVRGQWSEVEVYSGGKRPLKVELHPERIAEFPEKIPGNFQSAKALFDALTDGSDKLDADVVWTRLAKKIGNLQIDFTEAEWLQMIEMIKGVAELKKGE